jgi:hypothetical protein
MPWKRLLYGNAPAVASLSVQAATTPLRSTRPRSPFRVLVTHLFACFFATETSSTPPTTLMLQMSVALGLPPILLTLALIPSYSGMMPFLVRRTFWLQVQDHFIFVVYSCAVVGIVALLKWEGFFPTLLDVRVLSLLPISPRRLFAAKVVAAAAFIGAFMAGANLPASIFLPGMAGSHSVPLHIVAQVLAVSLAGLFTVTSALALMSMAALVPGRTGRIFGSLLQGAMIAVLLLLLFLSPLLATSSQPVITSGFALRLPPFWFVGIYDSLLNAAPESHLFAPLAQLALIATAASTFALAVLYPLAYRRKVRSLLEGESGARVQAAPREWLPRGMMSRYLGKPTQAASFHLISQTLFRIQRFRVSFLVACCAGAAIAITMVAKFESIPVYPFLRPSHLRPVSIATTLLLVALASVYLSLGSELEPRAAWIFETTVGRWDAGISSGVRRAVLPLCCAVAMFTLVFISVFAPVGPGLFVRESATLLGLCLALTAAFYFFLTIPFTVDPLRSRNMAVPVLIYTVCVLPVLLTLLERIEESVVESWGLVGLWLGGAIAVTVMVKRQTAAPHVAATPEAAEDPFQRLRL